MAKFKASPSKNIEDDTSTSGKGDRLKSKEAVMRQSGANALRVYTTNSGMASVQQRKNADALGLGSARADLQNTANKLQAVRRTRMDNAELPTELFLKRMQRSR